jgi:hypothetical protein
MTQREVLQGCCCRCLFVPSAFLVLYWAMPSRGDSLIHVRVIIFLQCQLTVALGSTFCCVLKSEVRFSNAAIFLRDVMPLLFWLGSEGGGDD